MNDSSSSDHLAKFFDPVLRFPERPSLAPDLLVFEMPDGLGFQFRGVRTPVLIRGSVAQRLLPWLLPLLDGTRDIQSLVESRPEGVTVSGIANVLHYLHVKGIIVASDSRPERQSSLDAATIDKNHLSRELLFWGRQVGITRANDSGSDIFEKITTASIVLVAEGLIGRITADLLSRQGCGSIRVLDRSSDEKQGVAVEGAVSANVFVEKIGRDDDDTLYRRLEELVLTTDLVVAVLRVTPSATFERINRICLRNKKDWIRVHDDGAAIQLGPYVRPGETACFTCMRSRRVSASDNAVEDELFERHLLELEHPVKLQGENLIASTCGASLLCSEVLRALTLVAPPVLNDATLTVSIEGAIVRNEFRQVPRCPDCYLGTVTSVIESGSIYEND